MSTGTIDAWMQHPTQRWLDMPFLDSLRRWSKSAIPEIEPPVSWTLDRMDEAGVTMGMLAAWHSPAGPLISNDEVGDLTKRIRTDSPWSPRSICADRWMRSGNSGDASRNSVPSHCGSCRGCGICRRMIVATTRSMRRAAISILLLHPDRAYGAPVSFGAGSPHPVPRPRCSRVSRASNHCRAHRRSMDG